MKSGFQGWILLLALLVSCGTNNTSNNPGTDAKIGEDHVAVTDISSDMGADLSADSMTDLVLPDEVQVDMTEDAEADVSPHQPAFDALAQIIEAKRKELGAPGLAVAILLDGKLVWAEGFGTKDPQGAEPVEATTLFRIGSLTKVMTAIGLLQQQEAGCLNVSDKLVDHINGFTLSASPEPVPEVTLHHLITHSSGISDFLAADVPPAQWQDDALSEYITKLMPHKVYIHAPPGRLFNYSNPNFMIAGLVLEQCAGQNYRDYVREKVWLPLGMERTFFRPADVLADGDYAVALGLDPETGGELIVTPDSYDCAWGAPAGFAFSSVLDLARFAEFLLAGNDNVLTTESHALLPAKLVNTKMAADELWYGYGIMINERIRLPGETQIDTPVWHHSGMINGFAANLSLLPEFGFGMITLASTNNAFFGEALVQAIMTLTDAPPPTPAPDVSDDPALYPDYVGEYLNPFNVGQMILSVKDGSLHLSMPDVDEAGVAYDPILVPISINNYLLTVGVLPIQLTVILDENGNGEFLRTRYFVGTRVDPDDRGAAVIVDKQRLLGLLQTPAAIPTF
jgi:CubicO group peptidase (beta-lactamase class C family)